MKLLSFDTSISSLSVAILDQNSIVDEIVVEPDRFERQEAVTKLLPTIDQILNKANWSKEELTHVCIGIGPGSFTGTRIGVVTARSLSQGLNIPVIGVNRFLALTEALGIGSGIILDGGRNHVFVAAYDAFDGEVEVEEPLVSPGDLNYQSLFEFLKEENQPFPWYAQASLFEKKIFDECPGISVSELPEIAKIASNQGKIAQRQLNSSNIDSGDLPIDDVKPLYLRGASITLKPNAAKSNPAKS